MKFFAVFAAVVALAAGTPWSWNLNELSLAIQNPDTNPEYLPYLEHALNQMMEEIYAGKPAAAVDIIVPTSTSWTLDQLSEALQDHSTDPALVPYLEAALNEMMHALHSGQNVESIPVVIPVGLKPVPVIPVGPVVDLPSPVPTPILPTPIIPTPVIPTPVAPVPPTPVLPIVPTPVLPIVPTPVLPIVPTPVLPTPVPESPAAEVPSSPLVQIVVNINQQQQVSDVTKPVLSEIEPTPVTVVEDAENIVVNPVDVIAINPPQINPVDVIAINPPQINPIDVIAVSP